MSSFSGIHFSIFVPQFMRLCAKSRWHRLYRQGFNCLFERCGANNNGQVTLERKSFERKEGALCLVLLKKSARGVVEPQNVERCGCKSRKVQGFGPWQPLGRCTCVDPLRQLLRVSTCRGCQLGGGCAKQDKDRFEINLRQQELSCF